ncbi:MAG: chloride channel protein [Ilumatobacteraceae bacterium]
MTRFAALRPYALAVVLGGSMSLFAVAFLFAAFHLQDLLFTTIPGHLDIAPRWWILIVCSTGGLVVGLLNTVGARRNEAHDVEEAIADSHRAAQGDPPPSDGVFVARVGLGVASLGFGGALGPEAPVIAYVSTLGVRVGALLKVAADESVQLSVAAALGGLFGTPLSVAATVDVDDAGGVTGGRLAKIGPVAVAAIAGLIVLRQVLPDQVLQPFVAAAGDGVARFGSGLAWAGLAAGVAALVARATLGLMTPARAMTVRLVPGGPVPQGLLGGIVLGIGGFITPLVLFSGHHETQELLLDAHTRSAWSLLGLAALKLLLLVAVLAAGWFGGQIFPMGFAGAAIALAIGHALGVGSELSLVAAGFTAASAVLIRRPFMTFLLLLIFFPSAAWPSMALATVAAAIVLAVWPPPAPAAHH